jgi:hypothetical protein
MGNIGSCPSGFESGVFLTCHAQCPAEFKYIQESGSPPSEKCIHVARNNRFFPLTSLPIPKEGVPIPESYSREQSRIETEAAKIKGIVREDDEQEKALSILKDQKYSHAREYTRIKSDYASFNDYKRDTDIIKGVSDSLKPMRPPTAPDSDLEIERRKIVDIQFQSLLFIQIALALLVGALVSYMILPVDYAHAIAFLLLSVAISFGFFLRR